MNREFSPKKFDEFLQQKFGGWDRATLCERYNAQAPEKLHISKANLSHWTTGKHSPDLNKLNNLLSFLGAYWVDVSEEII